MLAAEAPKVTDWMQAWGSIAGLVMSTFAVIFTGLLFRHEIRVRRDEKADSEAAQARLIVGRPVALGHGNAGLPGFTRADCLISNYSGAPIFNVRLRLLHNGSVLSVKDGIFSVLTEETDWHADLRKLIPVSTSEPMADWVVEIRFTDSSGHLWCRVGMDLPVRILPAQPSESPFRWILLLLAGAASAVAGIGIIEYIL
ncbi:hypothetical protein AB0B85_32185 [Micromonospora sp. NPDC049044]|uniref:hypothetical protein n=1 Tax=unclassified Micromonospora TaxID=2617518 RepID=UPI0033F7D0A0